MSGTEQVVAEEGLQGLMGPMEAVVVHHLEGLTEEAAVKEDRAEAVVQPFLVQEGAQRQKPGRGRARG